MFLRLVLAAQVQQRDVQSELTRKRTDKRTHIRISPAQQVQDRVFAVQQHLDIEQFQRQIEFDGQLPAALEELPAALAHAAFGVLIGYGGPAEKLAHCGVGQIVCMARRGLAQHAGNLNAPRAAYHHALAAAQFQRYSRAEAAKFAGEAEAHQVFLCFHRSPPHSKPRNSRM